MDSEVPPKYDGKNYCSFGFESCTCGPIHVSFPVNFITTFSYSLSGSYSSIYPSIYLHVRQFTYWGPASLPI